MQNGSMALCSFHSSFSPPLFLLCNHPYPSFFAITISAALSATAYKLAYKRMAGRVIRSQLYSISISLITIFLFTFTFSLLAPSSHIWFSDRHQNQRKGLLFPLSDRRQGPRSPLQQRCSRNASKEWNDTLLMQM